jgi:putative transposase
MTEKQQNDICEFRYSLIAEMANPHLAHGLVKSMIKEKAKRNYEIPYSTKNKLCEATIKQWLNKYKKYGKEALVPRSRDDSGRSRSIKIEDSEILINYLETHPDVCAQVALKKLQNDGVISMDITKSSLSRMLVSIGMDKKNRDKNNNKQENHLKFNFQYPLECVQSDCMFSIKIPDEKNKMKDAILIAFIDDATRRIVYSEFTFTEKSLVFEKGIKHILKSHGKIQKLYVDNGSTFISNQTKRILNILDIILVHSRPGKPAGRGKIERFFRRVQDQFIRILEKDSIKNISDLNIKFKTWLETEYHRTPHNGLEGETPLDVWLSKTKYLIQMPVNIDIDKVFLHEVTRKVYKDNTITLLGVLYEVPPIFAGETLKFYYDPNMNIKILEIYKDGKYYGNACQVDSYANTKIRRNYNTKKYEDTTPNDNKSPKKENNDVIQTSLNAAKIKLEAIK